MIRAVGESWASRSRGQSVVPCVHVVCDVPPRPWMKTMSRVEAEEEVPGGGYRVCCVGP